MNKIISLYLFFCITSIACANPINGLLERMQKGLSKKFKVELQPTSGEQNYFHLQGGGKQVKVTADTYISAAYGIHWYLKYHCQVNLSFCENRIPILPDDLPVADEKQHTTLTHNLYMNYCTFSYSTAFWDWKRWEYEIDLMALNGITTPMAMVGAEVVWQNTLRRFKYTDHEVKEFLCGPAYMGWLLMGNLEKIGGPLPNEWFKQQTVLQRKIVKRMREYGMNPIFQGFFGMVPASLAEKYPSAKLIDQGKWNSLNRPPMLDPADPLFGQMAQVWYEEYEKLFGASTFFGGDLFHEGGKTGGINVTKAAHEVQNAMLTHSPKATWVIQAWGGNPKNELLAGLDKERTMVFDICAEFWDNWRKREGFNGFPWIWGHLTNYGGNIGLHGRLDAIAKGSIAGRKDSIASLSMKGIGACPEGIEVNPVVFELANEMRWMTETPDIDQWLADYATRRYGVDNSNLKKAWSIFYQTAYGTFDGHRRPSESVFCAQPSLKGQKITASAWSQCKVFYDPALYAQGVALFLQDADELKSCAAYQYDAVDFVRQYLADLGRITYYQIVEAYQSKDIKWLKECSTRFLSLMSDQDALLSSHPRFMVSRWLEMARAHSKHEEIQDLYEYNARLLIGTWTENQSAVRDYAHKEWGGMIRDYYLPRWKNYLNYLQETLANKNVTPPNSFIAEQQWVQARNCYTLSGLHPVEVAKKIVEKYDQSN